MGLDLSHQRQKIIRKNTAEFGSTEESWKKASHIMGTNVHMVKTCAFRKDEAGTYQENTRDKKLLKIFRQGNPKKGAVLKDAPDFHSGRGKKERKERPIQFHMLIPFPKLLSQLVSV